MANLLDTNPGYKELFAFIDQISILIKDILNEFNSKTIKMSGLEPRKKIFLFFLARGIKTFNAIELLCRKGYGQDSATLLRSLLENLISIKYILCDFAAADKKTYRFVNYKWVIFKRFLSEDKTPDERKLILDKFEEYKKEHNIISDKALITWSGKTIKDMANAVDNKLCEEYDSVFRFCSRFSHPSIVGDKEYINYEDKVFTMKPLPSDIGIVISLNKSTAYLMDFLKLHNSLFNLNYDNSLQKIDKMHKDIFNIDKYNKNIPLDKALSNLDKDTIVRFEV
jgi:hypothetical protein